MTATSPTPTLSIVLATLNESQNLPQVFDRLRRQVLPPYELLVVDDGSTDGTREYLVQQHAVDPRVRYLFHDGKQTTLRAHCQGVEAALGRYVVIMDADLQHPPELLPAIVARLDEGAGLAVASRYAPGGSAGPRTTSRWTISHGAEWTARLLLSDARRTSDPVSGFFGFRRDSWVSLNPKYRGYKLLLFVLVMTEGRPVADVGYRFEPRPEGASKVTQSWAFVRMFLIEVILAHRLRSEIRHSPPRGRR